MAAAAERVVAAETWLTIISNLHSSSSIRWLSPLNWPCSASARSFVSSGLKLSVKFSEETLEACTGHPASPVPAPVPAPMVGSISALPSAPAVPKKCPFETPPVTEKEGVLASGSSAIHIAGSGVKTSAFCRCPISHPTNGIWRTDEFGKASSPNSPPVPAVRGSEREGVRSVSRAAKARSCGDGVTEAGPSSLSGASETSKEEGIFSDNGGNGIGFGET